MFAHVHTNFKLSIGVYVSMILGKRGFVLISIYHLFEGARSTAEAVAFALDVFASYSHDWGAGEALRRVVKAASDSQMQFVPRENVVNSGTRSVRLGRRWTQNTYVV